MNFRQKERRDNPIASISRLLLLPSALRGINPLPIRIRIAISLHLLKFPQLKIQVGRKSGYIASRRDLCTISDLGIFFLQK